MTEHRSSKASEIAERLIQSAANREPQTELEQPKLRIHRDAPAIRYDGHTPVENALHRLETEHIGTLALRGSDGEPRAVMLSVERYLDLAAKELRSAPGVAVKGQVWMPDETLKASHVEQVDPGEPWEIMPTQLT